MRVLRRLLPILFVAALLTWGWTYDAPAEPRPFVQGEELAWIRTFESWLLDAQDFLDEARADAADPVMARDLDDCLDFEDRIDDPPTARLAAVHRRARRACEEAARFEATVGADPVAADRHWRRADDLLFEADDAVYELFGYTGPPSEGDGDTARAEARLSAVASDWLGYDADVRCFPAADWYDVQSERKAWYGDWPDDSTAGFADTDRDRIVLGPDCAELIRLVSGKVDARPDDEDLAFAIGVLAHEIAHVEAPDADEDEAECVAVQRIEWTARRLGLPAATAARLARTFWLRVYPDDDEDYRSAECRDGGELDEHPRTAGWP